FSAQIPGQLSVQINRTHLPPVRTSTKISFWNAQLADSSASLSKLNFNVDSIFSGTSSLNSVVPLLVLNIPAASESLACPVAVAIAEATLSMD
ncbi:hypothetical protein M0654_08640, partial [Rhizobium sp. NTR19]